MKQGDKLMTTDKITVEPKQELKAEIEHLRQAARCSCDSYIGRLTRQLLNRQADEKEKHYDYVYDS